MRAEPFCRGSDTNVTSWFSNTIAGREGMGDAHIRLVTVGVDRLAVNGLRG